MRINDARTLTTGKTNEDVSRMFGLPPGTATGRDIDELMEGHDGMESLELNHDGSKLRVTDRRNTKFFSR